MMSKKSAKWMMISILFTILGAGEIRLPVSFSAEFVQKVTNPKKKVLLYKGTVLMNGPDTLKWSYTEPVKKEVCSDRKRVTVVDHDLEQVSFYRMDKGINLAEVLENARHHKDNLYIAQYREKNYTIALDQEGMVEQISYRDDLDNVVNIHFYKMKYGSSPIRRSKLLCPYPKSYDIIGG